MLFFSRSQKKKQEEQLDELKKAIECIEERLLEIVEKQEAQERKIEKAIKLSSSAAKDIISIDTVLRTAIYSQNQLSKDVDELFNFVKELEGVESVTLYGFGSGDGSGYIN